MMFLINTSNTYTSYGRYERFFPLVMSFRNEKSMTNVSPGTKRRGGIELDYGIYEIGRPTFVI